MKKFKLALTIDDGADLWMQSNTADSLLTLFNPHLNHIAETVVMDAVDGYQMKGVVVLFKDHDRVATERLNGGMVSHILKDEKTMKRLYDTIHNPNPYSDNLRILHSEVYLLSHRFSCPYLFLGDDFNNILKEIERQEDKNDIETADRIYHEMVQPLAEKIWCSLVGWVVAEMYVAIEQVASKGE